MYNMMKSILIATMALSSVHALPQSHQEVKDSKEAIPRPSDATRPDFKTDENNHSPLILPYHPFGTYPDVPNHRTNYHHDNHENNNNNNNTKRWIVPKTEGMYTCTGRDFTGDCIWTQLNMNVCYQIGSKNEGDYSLGPDHAIQCKLYSDKNCGGLTSDGTMTWPGSGVMASYSAFFIPAPAKAMSYRCKFCRDPDCAQGVADKW